jgi:hypothetical protein
VVGIGGCVYCMNLIVELVASMDSMNLSWSLMVNCLGCVDRMTKLMTCMNSVDLTMMNWSGMYCNWLLHDDLLDGWGSSVNDGVESVDGVSSVGHGPYRSVRLDQRVLSKRSYD